MGEKWGGGGLKYQFFIVPSSPFLPRSKTFPTILFIKNQITALTHKKNGIFFPTLQCSPPQQLVQMIEVWEGGWQRMASHPKLECKLKEDKGTLAKGKMSIRHASSYFSPTCVLAR